MALVRLKASFALAAGLIAVLGLAGCGRKDGLDPPPSAALAPPAPAPAATAPSSSPASSAATAAAPGTPQGVAAKNGFDAEGNPVAAPGQKKSFPLDFLLQ